MLEHSYGCSDDGTFRTAVFDYMIKEGYLDEVDNIPVIDNYL